MSEPRRTIGLRAQILLIVLGGAVLPLGLAGLWLTSSGMRAARSCWVTI